MCRAYFPLFHFNASTGQCERFVYGGCGGNGNRFTTKQNCIDKCGTNIGNKAINLTETSPDFDQIDTYDDFNDAFVDDLKFEPSELTQSDGNLNRSAMDRATGIDFVFVLLMSLTLTLLQ